MAAARTDERLDADRHAESRLPATPGLVLGPFYPVHLARRLDKSERRPIYKPLMPIQHLELTGRVLDRSAAPLAGATIELWHADPQGRYQHPSQSGVEDIDSGFVGYQALTSGADGCWHVETVVPGPYARDGVARAPHLHFQVTHQSDRLVTQMFFPDHPLNAADRWYGAASKPSLLLAKERLRQPQRVSLTWDIVIARS